MQKHELIAALEGFMAETDIRICEDGTNDVREIRRVTYQPAKGEAPAFLCLVSGRERAHDYASLRCWCGEANHARATSSGGTVDGT